MRHFDFEQDTLAIGITFAITEIMEMSRPNYPIVAIGASAGNQESLKQFFGQLPDDLNASFVIILHLLQDYPSHMPEIIARFTGMPVQRVYSGTRPKPSRVYVMPEGVTMTISNGQLNLYGRQEAINKSIDKFFISLSKDQGSRAIAIVLSGMGTAGTSGSLSVHEFGGTVMAQDPDTTQYKNMPRSVITEDHPSFVGSPSELAQHLTRILQAQKSLDRESV